MKSRYAILFALVLSTLLMSTEEETKVQKGKGIRK